LRGVGRVLTKVLPHFLKNYPNLPDGEILQLMEEFTHCLEEAELRNLDMKHFAKYVEKPIS
ncbi:MAG: hypothetical protein AB3N28_00030, partial [Kordiimonas sp.]